MGLNLIVETPAPKEEFEYIVEEGNSKDSKNFYINPKMFFIDFIYKWCHFFFKIFILIKPIH